VIAEKIVDGSNARHPVFPAAHTLDRAAVNVGDTPGRSKAASRSVFGVDVRRQVFPAETRGDRESLDLPSIHAVKRHVGIEVGIVIDRRVIGQ